jgi:hypothetical protein
MEAKTTVGRYHLYRDLQLQASLVLRPMTLNLTVRVQEGKLLIT